MHAEASATDIENVARRDKASFQRMAVDALRVHTAGICQVRGYDLGPGRNDEGFDAELEGTFEGLSGRVRVSVKGNLAWSELRRDARVDAVRHPAHPLLLICALALNAQQLKSLKKDATEAGVPAIHVADGSTLATWLREAPHLAEIYLHAAVGALLPMQYALVQRAPRVPDRTECGPWLASEEALVDDLQLRTLDGVRATLLVFAPDTRPDRCLWKLAKQLSMQPISAALSWARTDGQASLPAAIWASPALASRPHLFVVSWGERVGEFVRWWSDLPSPATGAHQLVLAVPEASVEDISYELRVHGRGGSVPSTCRLDVPSHVGELDALAAWLRPSLHSQVRRESFIELYGRRPALMELGAAAPELLASKGGKAFPDIADLRTLATIAILGIWRASAPVLAWMAMWLERDAPFVDDLAQRAANEGWLQAQGAAWVPSSRASRWAIVHAWKTRDTAGFRRFLQELRNVPREVLEALVPGMAESELFHEVEAYLLRELHGQNWHEWDAHLGILSASGERAHGRILELAEHDLKNGSTNLNLAAISDVVLVSPRFPKSLRSALRVCALLKRAGLDSPYSTRGPGGLVAELAKPDRVRAPAALAVLEWVVDALHRGEFDITFVEPLIAPWLKDGVGVEESSGSSISIGTSRWNEGNPHLPGCWRAASDVVLALVSAGEPSWREVGWRLIQSAGEEVARGPRPLGLRPPQPLVDAVSELIRASVAHLPPEDDWEARHAAERALLIATEHSFIDAGLAVVTLNHFSRDPLFRAWELCVDRSSALADLDGYSIRRARAGGDEARRWRVTSQHELGEDTTNPLVRQLVEAAGGAEGVRRVAQAVAASIRHDAGRWSGSEILRRWAAADASAFEPVILGPLWSEIPDEARWSLMWAVAPVFGTRLLAWRGDGPTEGGSAGAADEIAQLFRSPASVAAARALPLLVALEQVIAAGPRVEALSHLAAHPDPRVRRELSGWFFNLQQRRDPKEVVTAVSRLTRCPGGLMAVEVLLTTLRGPKTDHTVILRDELVAALAAHVDHEDDEAAWQGVRRDEYTFRPLFWALLVTSPNRWWRLQLDRLGRRGFYYSHGDDALSSRPSSVGQHHLAEALRAAPTPLDQPGTHVCQLVDALVSQLSPPVVRTLCTSLSSDGREADARAILVAAGARLELADTIAEVGARMSDAAMVEEWIRRLAFGGLTGFRGLDQDAELASDDAAAGALAATWKARARNLLGHERRVLELLAEELDRQGA